MVLDWTTLKQDRHWKSWAIQRAGLRSSALVLDVGCGTCVTEELLQKLGCQVVGLDLTEEMLRLGKAKGLPGVALLIGDAEALPFPDASFDRVLSFYVAKYCDLEKFVSESTRVLRRGGKLVIYDFARPRGLASPILRLYIYGFLRIAGLVTSLLDGGMSYTFLELPAIVESTVWDCALPRILGQHQLAVEDTASLSGGAVRAYVLSKG